MPGTVYFLKIAKFIPSKKNKSVLIAKISSPKNTKNRQSAKINSDTAKISCHTVVVKDNEQKSLA